MAAIKLSGDCSIYGITDVQQLIDKKWDVNKPLTIDLSGVSDFDPSLIQLLMSCKTSAIQHNQPFEMVNMSEDIQKVLDTMLVTDYFSALPEKSLSDVQ